MGPKYWACEDEALAVRIMKEVIMISEGKPGLLVFVHTFLGMCEGV